jgi:hypothetical protein
VHKHTTKRELKMKMNRKSIITAVVAKLNLDHDFRSGLEFISEGVFYVTIRPTEELTSSELLQLTHTLDYYSRTPHRINVDVDGVQWCIGDSDDAEAVVFDNGTFKVWVRHFKT